MPASPMPPAHLMNRSHENGVSLCPRFLYREAQVAASRDEHVPSHTRSPLSSNSFFFSPLYTPWGSQASGLGSYPAHQPSTA